MLKGFNKLELELISEAFHYAEDSPCWHYDKKLIESTLLKLNKMIDNYEECNHDGWAKCRFCGENFKGIEQ